MQANYPLCLSEVFRHEGGYTNHPRDPGGPTNWGITIHDARKYWKRDATAQDVKEMPKGVAAEIYQRRYWVPVAGDMLPAGVDLCVFDAGVNSGVSRSLGWLRKALPSSTQSPAGLAKETQRRKDTPQIVKRLCGLRMGFLQRLSTFGTFGRGWTRRVAQVEALGFRMALAGEVQSPEKELQKEADDAKKQAGKEATKGAGGVAGSQAPQATQDFSWFDPSSWDTWTWLLVGGTVLATVGACVYFGYRFYVHHQRALAYTAEAKRQTNVHP